MLRIYRRHRTLCPHTSERYRRCSCPIYVEGSLGGETVRQSLDQTSWEAASDLIAAWTASGKIGIVHAEIPTITGAVEKFFADATARQLQPATISKLKNLLEKRLLPWCEHKGFRHLKQLDVDALLQFRATWPDGPLSAYKNLQRLRAFFWFCHRADWIEKNPAVAVKPPRLPDKSTKVKEHPTLATSPDAGYWYEWLRHLYPTTSRWPCGENLTAVQPHRTFTGC